MNATENPEQDGLLRVISRVFQLLTSKERQTSLLMLGTVVLNSVVEVLGLAAVVPVIGLAIQPEAIHRYERLDSFYGWTLQMGVETESDFLILLSILLVVVFAFKAAIGLALTLFQTRFSFSVAHRLSGIMWSYHFSQNLENLRGSNSGRILAEINVWPAGFANAFMVGSLRLITEVFVIAVICIGLLVYEPIVLVSVAILMASGTLFIRKLTNQRLKAYGRIQQDHGPQTNAMVTNAIRGFLEVITFRAEEPVRKAYLGTAKLLYRVSSNASVLNSLPAKTYEVLAVMGVSGAIVISLLLGTAEDTFFEMLTLMAIGAYRIMPTMSRINGVRMEMKRSMFLLGAIEKGVEVNDKALKAEGKSALQLQGIPSIVLRDLTVGYAALETPVLTNLTHEFRPGRIHGVVGASGTGKSTLVNAMLGIHPLQGGEVLVADGTQEWSVGKTCSRESWLAELGYLSQQPFFFSGSVTDNLTFRAPGRTVDATLVLDLIERLGLSACLGKDPLQFQLNEAGSNLSGGQQQRLALLRSLQMETKVLLLDEATSALDVDSRDRVFAILRERADQGALIIIITHDRELAARCDETLDLDT